MVAFGNTLMLTLSLALKDYQVSIHANGKESHQFSLLELSQSKEAWKGFLANPRIYGETLFNALFRDAARVEFDALSRQTERTIVLVLESPELDGVAWEYAYNKAKAEYVVEDCAFVRALPENERPSNGRLKASYERIPLLFIPANPLVDLSGEPLRALDEESEWKEMSRHNIASNAGFDLLQMLPATPKQLQTVMAQFHNGLIVHFSGHGAATKDGAILLFEEENGASNPLEAREFVREIKDKAAIAFLSACQSAVAERTEFSNLARELAKAGVPFALGMQFNLPDPFAPEISGQFYNYLTRGHSVLEAARQARRAVKRENEFFVGMLALYAAHPDEAGVLTLRQAQGKPGSGTGAQTLSLFRPADVSDLPAPANGLIGRQRELMRIGTGLLEGKKPLTVTLHGAGGIGKTALLWQALLRFAPSFELTLAIGLDPLPSLESALGRIERFLGFPSPCANDTKEREALVRNALTSKRTFLGLDNFETLNHALNEAATQGIAKSLYAFFKSLPAAGVTLCVTSREKTGLPGEHIEEICGLKDAMGGALFYENVSTRKDALNEEDLEILSAAVGGHPLALRLLAPTFEEQAGLSLEQFIDKLQAFLLKASDQWSEQERHASLGACFAFSMDNLLKTAEGKNLHIALARLSVFTAFFYDIIAAPVLENYFPVNDIEEFEQMCAKAKNILHNLWERGLLERFTIELEKSNFYLYRLHPALNWFAMKYVAREDQTINQNMHWLAMLNLAKISFPNKNQTGVWGSATLSVATRLAMPDLLKASARKEGVGTLFLLKSIAFLKSHFGDWDEALQFYQQALEMSEDLGLLGEKSIVLQAIANLHIDRGDLDGAIQLFEKTMAIDEQLGDLEGKAKNLSGLALINVKRGNLDKAMQLYQQSLEVSDELGLLPQKSLVLHSIANICAERGNFDQAMQLYQQSIEIDNELGDFKGKSDTLCELANIHAKRGEFDEAIRLYQESLNISEWLGEERAKADTINRIANVYMKRGNLDKAMQLYQQSLEISDELGLLQQKSLILHSIANICAERGNFDQAMQLYQQSIEIDEGLVDLKSKANTLNQMAHFHVARGELDEAVQLYNQVLKIYGEIGDLRLQAIEKEKLAKIYVDRGDLDEAMQLLHQALETTEELGDLVGKSSILTRMAEIYVKRGDLSGAIKLCQRVLEITEELGDLQGKSITLYKMANIYVAIGNLDEAMKLYQQSLEITESIGALNGKALTLTMMAQIDAMQKNYRESLEKLLSAKNTAMEIGANSSVQSIESIEKMLQTIMGFDEFEILWKELTGKVLPDWLMQQDEQEQGMTAEQFIVEAIQSARGKSPEAEGYFKAAQKMAADSSISAEMRELGRVLSRIMAGDTKVDLSGLPEEWAKVVLMSMQT